MPYNKTNWTDRTVQYPNRFTRATADGFDTLTPAPGTIASSGTPITAEKMNNIENGISDVDTRLTSVESKSVSGSSAGNRFEECSGTFFTNGNSDEATANVTFAKAFTVKPTVFPANISQVVAYGRSIKYPYIFNVTTTGFSVTIYSIGGNLGTSGSPANLFMNFMAYGK